MEHVFNLEIHHLTAVYTQGKLLLAAAGKKPHPDDRVVFERVAGKARIPSFGLRLLPTDELPAARPSIPYQVAMLFAVGAPPPEVTVCCGSDTTRLAVLVPGAADALERRQPVPLIPLAATRALSDEDELPAPFAELLAQSGEDVRTPVLWPIRLGPLFDGRFELAEAAPRRAIGYSETFDFSEALQNALASLAPAGGEDVDRLTAVHVTETGALLGGVDGACRLFVTILAY